MQMRSPRAKFLTSSFLKSTIPELDCPGNLSSIVARLHTGYFKGVEISPDNFRSYPICRNCSQTQLTPDYIFDCKAILAPFLNLMHHHRSSFIVLKLQI
ncbi:hypothetical protein TNCV_4676741 [Trichonephila clavipes]|nr:hypothetical protein TNCV_4676741 [Trichonephila clavipes]